VKKTAQQILTEYGAIGVVVYFAIFFAVLFGFWAAIRAGWHPKSVGGGVGSFTAAYIATKLTQPLRIAATVALTPLVARRRHKGEPPAEPTVEESD
jgi:O-antigen ligase